MQKVRPLADRVLVRVQERARTTSGGVILPENIREQSDRGEVLAVGPGKQEDGGRTEIAVQAGEVVLFSPYAGSKVEIEGDDRLLLLREADILGVLEDASTA